MLCLKDVFMDDLDRRVDIAKAYICLYRQKHAYDVRDQKTVFDPLFVLL